MRNLPKIGLVAVIIVYVCFAFAISWVASFNEGPDEETNLAYTEFITVTGRLPITYEEREKIGKDSNWPALYHFMVAGLSNALEVEVEGPPYIKIFWDSFRYRAVDAGWEWYYLHTEDQEWPYYGRILVLYIGRWLSILFGVVTLLLVYYLVLEIFRDRHWLALAAVAVLAFIPVFTFMSSVMNEDTLMAALATLYLWMLIRVVKQPQKMWPYWVMGLALGVSVTAKYTTIILPVEVLVVIAVVARQKDYTWRWWLQRVTIVGGSAVLASSWWFGWNFLFLNEVEERGWLIGLLRPIFTGGPDITLARLGYFFSGGEIGLAGIPEGKQMGTFSRWAQKTFFSFWGESIDGSVPLFPYVYIAVSIIIGAVAVGLWRLWRINTSARQWLVLLICHTGLFLVLPLLRFSMSRRLGETAQGRHVLIPAVAAVAVLITWGLATIISQRWQRWVFPVIIIGFIVWTGAHLNRLAVSAASLVPLRTLPEAAEWLPNPVNTQFGDAVELASYDFEVEPDRGLMHLTLAWRSLTYTNESYLLKVNLVDSQGAIVSHWVGYNGHGRLPTLAWDPGDSVFDRLALPLPNLPAGNYQVQVQLVGNAGPLSLNNGSGQSNTLSLTQISLKEPAVLSFPHRMSIGEPDDPAEIAFAIWKSDGPVKSTKNPNYRYPATISVIVSNDEFDGALNLQLVDADGREWTPTQAEANIYAFVIGPRWQSSDYRLQITSEQGEEIVSESLLTIENWWERQFEMPKIEVSLEANFANQINLLGYKLSRNQVRAGEAFPITLYWQAPPNTSPQANFIQFNNLLDSTGTLHGGYDRRPLEYYSTLLWAPGEVVVDGYAVPVDVDASPGEYYLNVGYYIIVGESAVNLPLVVSGEMTDVSSVTIGPIEVMAGYE